MIVTENVRFGRREFKKTYSSEGFFIRKGGTDEIYSEAIDLPSIGYTYEETDRKIETEGEGLE